MTKLLQKIIILITEEKATDHITAAGLRNADVNGDGDIDMSDVVLIMQALANPDKFGINGTDPTHITENGFKFGDTNGDGLTLKDALRIQEYLLGKITSLV